MTINSCIELSEQAQKYLILKEYYQAHQVYEKAISIEPNIKSNYWYLGLILLLQDKPDEAQTTWFMAIMEGQAEEIDNLNSELITVLETEAKRHEEIEDYFIAQKIRQQIKEFNPTDIKNLCHLIILTTKLKSNLEYGLESLLAVIKLFQSQDDEHNVSVEFDLLLETIKSVLDFAPLHSSTLEFIESSLPLIQQNNQIYSFLSIILPGMIKIGHILREPKIAADIGELYLIIQPHNIEVLRHLASFYQNSNQYDKGIETAKLRYELVKTLPDLISSNQLIIRGLMSAGGYWSEAYSFFKRHESLLLKLIEEQPTNLRSIEVSQLFNSYFFAPYFGDNPKYYRLIQNQLGKLCQTNAEEYAKSDVDRCRKKHLENKAKIIKPRKLKIGYLSYCLRNHSVGWLARWLFQHHNREKFELYGYFINSNNISEPLHDWYVSQMDKVNRGEYSYEIVNQVYDDEVDILIDLDSMTLDISCEVLAVKPAPIQVTWLGWDATGIPNVDYFIADPYVLPSYAQEYYSEKIWRLPQSYIAVEGFEVGVSNIRRDTLDIPDSAIVYLSAQKSYKRNADTARLQMRIIKEVPNSYFLIKGVAKEESLKDFFCQIAEEEGVDPSQLRFIPDVPSESVHRANLAIADVILDTYPYNGATTTLETLWMCIPLVTKVGEQFAARNSYTMMMNAGIKEGIAWSDEEYIDWGIRLGKDETLRQNIAWKLRKSKQTAPLWNAKNFTNQMEKAYEEMWQIYTESK